MSLQHHDSDTLVVTGGRAELSAMCSLPGKTLQFPPIRQAEIVQPPSSGQLAEMGALVRQVALQKSSRDFSRVVSMHLPALIDADNVRLYYYDDDSTEAWHEADSPSDDIESSGIGIVGFAATSHARFRVSHASQDSHYAVGVDTPEGQGEDRLMVQPVYGLDTKVHAVFIATRSVHGEVFTQEEANLLRQFALLCSPLLDALAWYHCHEAAQVPQDLVFRRKALEHYKGKDNQGDVVRIYSKWIHFGYWCIALFFCAAFAYVCFAEVNEYATGPALVVSSQRTELLSGRDGLINEVLVRSGEYVEKGQVLVRLASQDARAAYDQINAQFEMRLVDRLQRPDDAGTKEMLAVASSRRKDAQRNLSQSDLRAPAAGKVGEVLLARGERVSFGEALLSVVPEHETMELVAMIPSGQRPDLEVGQLARVSVPGHPGEFLELPIQEISEDAYGPEGASRKIGRRLGDTVRVGGTVVFVRFDLPRKVFKRHGVDLTLHHGMQAVVEVKLRKERLITMLFPGLKEVF